MDQREWEKVAGRFEEIVLSQPPEQVVNLVGAALNVEPRNWPKGWEGRAKEAMRTLATLGWFGAGAPISSLMTAAPLLYPVHPSALSPLVRFFARFGQNERSLFSFLLSNEPGGLQEFARNHEPKPTISYRLHHFYDYVAANYGDKLGALSLQNHWNHIDAVVRSIDARWPEKAMIVKTVGILNLLQSNDTTPTEESLLITLSDDPAERQRHKEIVRSLDKKERVLHSRGKAGGYCLWSHTSVNLYEKYDEASRSLPTLRRLSETIRNRLDARPLVARRHYIETGNLRSFEVVYCPAAELPVRAAEPITDSDCRIVIPLCETNREAAESRQWAKGFANRDDTLIGIPQPLSGLEGLVREMERWEWICNNTPELKDDWFAAQEVNRKLECAKEALERRVQHFVGMRHSGEPMPLQWYYRGKEHSFDSGHTFLSWLSTICDQLFSKAPNVHNELINRRILSSAAARGRMKLVELLFKSSNQVLLGMDPVKRPPEMSMYFSVLKETTLHREEGGIWSLDFPLPKDPARLLPSLEAIRDKLESVPDSRVPVSELFAMLQRPPFGVRDGLIPLLLVVVLLKHHRDIAMYEDGTFKSEIASEEILRLTKVPKDFALQWCRIGGLRLNVFERLLGILGTSTAKASDAELLDVVRPLVTLVAGLPPYARTTKTLSPTAIAVRDVLLNAQDPTFMIFRDLPKACGLEPITDRHNSVADKKHAELFVERLKITLDEMRAAYPELLARISGHIRQAFDLENTTDALSHLRRELSQRAGALVPVVIDVELKGFCLRMADMALDDGGWLESVGSFIAAAPPSRWRNQDEYSFTERLHALIGKFLRTEAAAFSSLPKAGSANSVLVTITQRDGNEKSQVVHLTHQEAAQAEILKAELALKIGTNRRISVTALSRLVWEIFDKKTP
jgi:hypothetical protein